jgi:hypothetical protein
VGVVAVEDAEDALALRGDLQAMGPEQLGQLGRSSHGEADPSTNQQSLLIGGPARPS